MSRENELSNLYCYDLPTRPADDNRLILVTGANGYIGGRLIPELIARGYRVRIMVRKASPTFQEKWPAIEIIIADALNAEALQVALKGVHTAYYLMHSLGLGPGKFESEDLKIAQNFRAVAENRGVKRIIYLSGLGVENKNLSPHLENRIQVAQTLSAGNIPVTVLQAAMIIGSGSASYEILKNLVNNTPVFLIPYWAKTKCQPISIRGVIKYLVGVMEVEATAGKVFDIGGDDILTYEDNLRVLAKMLGKKKIFIPSFLSSSCIYSNIISLLTPIPKPVIKVLVEGCKNEVVCQNNEIKKYINVDLLSFQEALYRALSIENVKGLKKFDLEEPKSH